MTCPRGGHAGRSLRIGGNARFGSVRCDKLRVILTAATDCFPNKIGCGPTGRLPRGTGNPPGCGLVWASEPFQASPVCRAMAGTG